MSNVKKFWYNEDLTKYMHPIFTEECEVIAKTLYEENNVKLYSVLTTYDDYSDSICVCHKGIRYYKPSDFPEDLMEKLKKRLENGQHIFFEDDETLIDSLICFVFYYKIIDHENTYYICKYYNWNTFKVNSIEDIKHKIVDKCKDIIKKDLPVLKKYPTEYTGNKYDNDIKELGFTIEYIQKEIDELQKISDKKDEKINDKLKRLNDSLIVHKNELNVLKEKRNRMKEELERECFDNG